MIKSKNFDFSFSGLKTAVLYLIKKIPASEMKSAGWRIKPEICSEFQQSVVDVLVHKTLAAARIYSPKTIILAGGVSANQELRRQLGEAIQKEFPKTAYIIPDIKYSVDNSAMIASAGYFRYRRMNAVQKKELKSGWRNVQTSANLKLQ